MIWRQALIEQANEWAAQNDRLKEVLPRFTELVTQLSDICDRFVEDAPSPQANAAPGAGFFDLAWVNLRSSRSLAFTVWPDWDEPTELPPPYVHLVATHDQRMSMLLQPTVEQLTSYVRSFFFERGTL